MAAERHLLFAVLAFENELIDLVQLTSACRAWTEDKSQPLADLLVARDWLSNDDRLFVEKLVERKLAKHQDDPRVTLNAITRGDVCDAIKEVDDSDIQQSLSSWPSAGPVLIETIGETLIQSEQTKSRYTWLSEVGKGGLGKVWLARDNELSREVALKEIKPGTSAASQEAVRRLIKEAQITGQLQHPNIVPVYEVNRGGRPFYTMKLVKGQTLTKAIHKHHEDRRAGKLDPLSLPRLLNVFVKICDALAYAHSRGVIHRDLKPENIILGEFGEVIVLDWGLAKQVGSSMEESVPVVLTEDAVSEVTRAGATPGTLPYMAPEQARGRVDQMDQQTDIYGLGAILFEILTGEAPHKLRAADPAVEDQSPVVSPLGRMAAYLTQIADGGTPLAREREPSVPAVLNAVCGKAMARSKADRYASASALAEDIEHWLADEPVTAHRDTPLVTASRWARKHRAWAMSGAAALALVAVVSSVAAVWINSARGKVVTAQQAESKQLEIALRNEKEAQRQQSLAEESSVKANRESTRANREESRAKLERDQARRISSSLYHKQAVKYLAEDDSMRGLLSLARALELSPDEVAEQRSLRRNLSAWTRRTYHLAGILPHDDSVRGVCLSPDGTTAVTVSTDRQVRVWNVLTGESVGPPLPQDFQLYACAFSPDGKRFITAGGTGFDNWRWPSLNTNGQPLSGRAQVWDASSIKPVGQLLEQGEPIFVVAFSPDNNLIVTGGLDRTAQLWDARTLAKQGPAMVHDFLVCAAAFHPNLPMLLAVAPRQVIHWDTRNSARVRIEFEDQTNSLNCIAYDSSGETVVFGGWRTVKARIRESNGEWRERVLGYHTGSVGSIGVSGDGKRAMSSADDETIKLWSLDQTSPSFLTLRHGYPIYAVAWSFDQKTIVSGGGMKTGGAGDARLWTQPAAEQLPKMIEVAADHRIRITKLWEARQQIVTGGEDGTLRIWSAKTGQPERIVRKFESPVDALDIAGEKQRIIVGLRDGTVSVIDSESGEQIGPGTKLATPVFCVKTGPQDKVCVACGGALDRGEARLVDVATGFSVGESLPSRDRIHAAAFHPNGEFVALAGEDGTTKFWNTNTGQPSQSDIIGNQAIYALAISPDGRGLLVGTWNADVQRWDLESQQRSGNPLKCGIPVFSIAFSPDGELIATGDLQGKVLIWDAASGIQIGEPWNFGGTVRTLTFTADGQSLFIGVEGKAAQLKALPPIMTGSSASIRAWIETIVGAELDASDGAQFLDVEAWRTRRDASSQGKHDGL